jgi:hypothetical protein
MQNLAVQAKYSYSEYTHFIKHHEVKYWPEAPKIYSIILEPKFRTVETKQAGLGMVTFLIYSTEENGSRLGRVTVYPDRSFS